MKKTIDWGDHSHQIDIIFFCFLIFCAGSAFKKMVFKLKSSAAENTYQIQVQHQNPELPRVVSISSRFEGPAPTMQLPPMVKKSPVAFKNGNRFHRIHDYLKYQVGLDDQQIEIVRRKDREFKKDMRMANSVQVKKELMEKHHIWMTVFLGPEHYQEYQNIKLEQASNRWNSSL